MSAALPAQSPLLRPGLKLRICRLRAATLDAAAPSVTAADALNGNRSAAAAGGERGGILLFLQNQVKRLLDWGSETAVTSELDLFCVHWIQSVLGPSYYIEHV